MTQVEWLEATEPLPLLRFLKRRASDRKLRLFVVACCRTIWPLLDCDQARNAVEFGERYADGRLDEQSRLAARREVRAVRETLPSANATAAEATWPCVDKRLRICGVGYLRSVSGAVKLLKRGYSDSGRPLNDRVETEAANRFHVKLLRDIFGNPFRTVTVDRSWLTSDVLALATGIYEDRAFDRMPILADALQDAGCDHEGVLDHCRGLGPHVRGCWVIDLLLGRE